MCMCGFRCTWTKKASFIISYPRAHPRIRIRFTVILVIRFQILRSITNIDFINALNFLYWLFDNENGMYLTTKVQFCHTTTTKTKCIDGVYIKVIDHRIQDRMNKMTMNLLLTLAL